MQRAESGVYRNIRTQFFYSIDKAVSFESFLTRDHARVPIVIRGEKSVLGIIAMVTNRPSLSQTKSAGSFLKKEATSKIVFLSTQPISPEVINDRTLLLFDRLRDLTGKAGLSSTSLNGGKFSSFWVSLNRSEMPCAQRLVWNF